LLPNALSINKLATSIGYSSFLMFFFSTGMMLET
jgi:hypothetical protein